MQHDHQHHHGGPDAHTGHAVSMFRNKFWLCLVLTIPVLGYSPHIQDLAGIASPQFAGAHLIPFVLGSVIFFYGGLVFLRGAFGELKARRPGMMTLISLAVTIAYVYSVAVQFGLPGESFFWELATLVTIMLLGHWLEMASIARAQSAVDAIKQLLPDTAEKLINGKPTTVPVAELVVGDSILVRPGSGIPADGTVTQGISSVNEAAITGESNPVGKKTGDSVVAGTINQDGALTISITQIGENTALAGIMRLVAQAQASKSGAQILADKAAFALTITAIIAGGLTFVTWLILQGPGFALERTVTVLVIACPHALGLAIPLVVSISATLAARNGLLVRQRLALESARNIDIVLFDKTGTLTKGEHSVTHIWPAHGYTQDDILHLAASLEHASEHIIGKGIVRKADEQLVQTQSVHDFAALPGIGVSGTIRGKSYIVANQRYISERNIPLPTKLAAVVRQTASPADTQVYVVENNRIIGVIALADEIRPESIKAVAALRQLGVESAMITGDSKQVAAHAASQIGLDQYFAQVRPDDKADTVKKLQAKGLRVAMVGDGINDAPALAQADIGIAIGAGTDIAIKSADIILVKSDPRDVVKVIQLSAVAYRKMIQNLVWATGYNIVAIPLAAGAFYGAGIVLSPAVGAVLMSVSTIVVAANAQLLRRLRLD